MFMYASIAYFNVHMKVCHNLRGRKSAIAVLYSFEWYIENMVSGEHCTE